LEIAATLVEIDTNSLIDVTACGKGSLPATTGRSGGSYGGRGGNRIGISCETYGDPFLPEELGSGGPITLGGGKIHITATTFELNGVLKANGEDAPEYAGSGSGGSIFVEAETLTGNGMMQANGGAKGRDGACGGGGRIAIHYDSIAGFNLNKIECAGENAGSSTYNGGAGTIYIKNNAETYGRMILDNMNLEYSSYRPTDIAMITNRFDRLFVNNKARLDLTLSNDLYLTDTVLSGAYVTMTGNVAGPNIILTNGQWTHAGIFGFSNAVILTDNSLLSHVAGYTNGLNIMAQMVYVETNSQINVSERGGTTRPGTTGRSGGSYGGRGENRSGESCPIYGDIFYPVSLGSGGSETRGGGKIRVTATTFELKGALKANGENGPGYVGGGSGGAILVETVSLSGNGTVEANGGAEGGDAGAGGGGRIAIYYIEMSFPSTNITVNPGAGHTGTDGEGSLVLYGPRERFLVSTNSPYSIGEKHHFMLRSGVPAPVGLRVQCLASETNGINAFAAPTTNRWNENIPDGSDAFGYFVPYDCHEDTVRMTRMGDELVLTNATDAGQPGFVASSVGFSISNRSSRGWMRAFSHTTITGAAFYADTVAPDTTLDWPGNINCAWQPGALVLSNVNPAYVLQFTVAPYADIDFIEGIVDCVEDGGDNKLPGKAVMVEFLLEGETAWRILDDELDGNGGFIGLVIADIYPTGVYVRARVKDTFSPRPGLPASASVGPIMVVPETVSIVFIMPLFILAWRHWRNY